MPEPNFNEIFEETFSFDMTACNAAMDGCDADIEPDIFPKKRRPNPEEGFQLN